MKKSAVRSAKCSIVAARKASLQRKRRLGIDLSEAGLGPERIRALVLESVENLRRIHEARRRQRTSPNVVLTVSYAATGGSSPLSRGRTADLHATHHFQNAENLVLGDVEIVTAGGNVERHMHEHFHFHIQVVRPPRRRARNFEDSDTFPEGSMSEGAERRGLWLHSTRKGVVITPHTYAMTGLVFFF
ncbi:hypothetical protein DFP72DRAFT_906410 [Ephemerocybe angulata]|uniref:Uncharacterized protein n=1 Tax=Ephemerocybe angulata TaxID=980116 RepID=A0A8H6HSD7_9AGAR|nr:hypothetical protein DFP72DRAFT_906410 [Tulosesus angulatus]